MFNRQLADGKVVKLSQGQLIGEILYYLRSQTQLVIGHAVKVGDIVDFLRDQQIEP